MLVPRCQSNSHSRCPDADPHGIRNPDLAYHPLDRGPCCVFFRFFYTHPALSI
ncbi:hypothetical protein Rcae01_02924 [Novipirellula caenicola]|uniref:Uncharacterized protein n=1 Tax=Novipirellula caenicola TaxID=1536901 RepID=A0ABP9VTC0_9BACT